jgi:hyperosmotically inducible protein
MGVSVRAESKPHAPQAAGKKDHKTPVATNASITAKVKSALLADKITPGLRIDVDTDNGTVTLTGKVDNQAQKERAGRIAAKTEGVTKVVNRLTIKPAAHAKRSAGTVIGDATITAKVKSALLADKVAPGMAIDVDTIKGVVTLTGHVDGPPQKNRAEAVAKKVNGVKHVINHLTFKPKS